jgi:hypothetical protein
MTLAAHSHRRRIGRGALVTSLVMSAASVGCGAPEPIAGVSTAASEARTKPPTTTLQPWELENPATKQEIEGYASAQSVDKGAAISIFVRTGSPRYAVAVYRTGWYGGAGALLVSGPVANVTAVAQPGCVVTEASTALLECAWRSPFVVQTAAAWKSGVYLAKLTAQGGRTDGKTSYVVFVVRDDASTSRYLAQLSFNTYQAYNSWGGKSLYSFNSSGGIPAYKVSFDRPYVYQNGAVSPRGIGAGEYVADFKPGWDYNLVRFLEREGYDVTYTTDYDVGVRPQTLLQHAAFLVLGHSEYWTMAQRDAIVAARDAGVNLGVFGSNVGFWQVRYEPSHSGALAPDRTMIGYKGDAVANDPVGPSSQLLTTQFRRLANPLPENRLLGVMYGTDPVDADVVIDDDTTWVTANTGLTRGSRLAGLMGYEIDFMTETLNASHHRIGHSLDPNSGLYGDMTVYTAASGATVFATGSMQWGWGLDDYGVPDFRASRLSPGAQQITRNVLAKLGGT